ncbi:polyprenyl synthetase family protein [Criblamydia sequanensis]|uniref:Farnesyltranstransferase n=1 Tax=Candidatus Criblamydia sequanensis CRIB-18 TaxID=1437425 RepID=A0A090D0X0_9BACT|nr:farnesyl diphosphate synthase [Criblamydia sequanensis]CDR35001.1 Putative farnesyltranstransferase [Criblamydia sequanensis CRIB-18]
MEKLIEKKMSLDEKRALINARLSELVPETSKEHALLFESARYSLLGGGKRLRPLLMLSVTEAYGLDCTYGLDAACVLEMIHTYSLIHDDLPCMDDDDLRRGQPTLHKKVGEAIALLAGDYLLTHSFEVLSKMADVSSDKKVALIQNLAKAGGGFGMIGGQVMDMESECKRKLSLEELNVLHQKKTGALIICSLLFGGILADAKDADLQILLNFGRCLGAVFQIIDDVIDVTESTSTLGKTALSDVSNNKLTYVSLLGVEKSLEKAKEYQTEGLKYLDEMSIDTESLRLIADSFITRKC